MEIGKFFPEGKHKRILLVAGIAAVVLIALSVFWPEETEEVTQAPAEAADAAVTEYEEKLCEQVKHIVTQIEGVGEADVHVMLESGIEYVYAKEEKSDTDISGETTRASLEENLILVEDANGHKTALLQKMLLPAVRGVVVVCEGGGDPQVVNAVTDAVKTALGIRTTQIFVAKRTAKTVQ